MKDKTGRIENKKTGGPGVDGLFPTIAKRRNGAIFIF
ncbi:hypothetical protein JOD24_000062 [Kroppenstedtia sanguinis]